MRPGAGGSDGLKIPVTFAKRSNHRLILFAFDGAGGVDELAARFEDAGGVLEEESLLAGEGVDVVFGDAVADLGVAAQRAGAGTGRVDEDAIEGAIIER